MVNRCISGDLKECSLRLWEAGWDRIDIIEDLAVSHPSKYRWRAIFEELGDVIRPPSPLKGRTRIISRVVLMAIYNIYKGDPDLYLDKLQGGRAFRAPTRVTGGAGAET